MKKKSKSLSAVLLVLVISVIVALAFACFRGFVLFGYEFKSFGKVLTKGLRSSGWSFCCYGDSRR